MTNTNRTNQMVAKWMRWIARGLSTLAALAWLFIFLNIVACEALFGFVCFNPEMALLAGLAIASLASVLIAWRWDRIGGVVMILWGVIFATIAYVTSKPYETISILGTGIPFLIAGCLFLASGSLRQAALNNGQLSMNKNRSSV
jgi:hypothetical protein